MSNKKNQSLINNFTLGYSHDFVETQTSTAGVLIYVSTKYNYCVTNDLSLYKSKELKSLFLELILPYENLIVGCIYNHPFMHWREFNEDFLDQLLLKVSKENKTMVVAGDFNFYV